MNSSTTADTTFDIHNRIAVKDLADGIEFRTEPYGTIYTVVGKPKRKGGAFMVCVSFLFNMAGTAPSIQRAKADVLFSSTASVISRD